MNPVWSYVLTTIGVTGIWLSGRKSRWGWAVGIGAQFVWLAYSIATQQWGFLFSCFAYGSVYVRNFIAWSRERTREAE